MVELVILLVWIGTGAGLALLGNHDERGAGSVAGGALLGPLWWVIMVDRRALAISATSLATSNGASGGEGEDQMRAA